MTFVEDEMCKLI